jgi:hypothetical protein
VALLVATPLATMALGWWQPPSVIARYGWIPPYQPGKDGYVRYYNYYPIPGAERFLFWVHVLFAALLLVGALRLLIAYRCYLQFHRPRATVLASQLILLLLALVIALNWRDNDLMWYWRRLMGM